MVRSSPEVDSAVSRDVEAVETVVLASVTGVAQEEAKTSLDSPSHTRRTTNSWDVITLHPKLRQ